jgi:hypothetical protein
MKTETQIVLFISFFCLYSYGQGSERCDNSYSGIKTVVSIAEEGSFFIPDKEVDYYNTNGKLIKTEIYYDTLLTKIDTFIYTSDERLLWRKTIDPETRTITQVTKFLYDSSKVNYRSIVTSFELSWVDSFTLDTTGYHHIRYDFIRNEDNLFTERKTYYSTDKIAEFDTSKFEISYQTWEGDSIVMIEDLYTGRTERLRKFYKDCKLVRTEFLNEKDSITTVYEYEYKNLDKAGNWLVQEIYITEDGVKELINKYTREIELY